eukprot:jgi/Undpi1/7296/HiC_scaffold_22.g09769.m1
MSTTTVGASARLRLRLWSYALAEAIPKTRQRLHLSPQEAGTNVTSECRTSTTSSGSAAFRIDAALAAKLSDESISRGIPLASILLASLFLAAAKTVRLEQEALSNGSLQNRPFAVRAQRGFVLGIVCLVMALLSGSAESKAMRYFCSFYAVIAGKLTAHRVWAVNAISIEKPGYTILMATSATLKAGEGAAGVTVSPARLSVDCWHDLWESADKHHHETRRISSPAGSFEEFKKLACSLRRRFQREREGESRPPFQLFGCIQLEGNVDGTRAAPAPEEAVGIQPFTEAGGDDDFRGDSPAAVAAPKCAPELSLLQSIIDARYTLVYRVRKAGCSERGTLQGTLAPAGGGVVGDGGKGNADGDDGRGRSTVQENQPPTLAEGDESRVFGDGGALGGIDLVLVERARWTNGKGPKWLLEGAMTILSDECGGNPGVVGRTC